MNLDRYYSSQREIILKLIYPLKPGVRFGKQFVIKDIVSSLDIDHYLEIEIKNEVKIRLAITSVKNSNNYVFGVKTKNHTLYLDNNFINLKYSKIYQDLLRFFDFIIRKNEPKVIKINFFNKECQRIFSHYKNNENNKAYKFNKLNIEGIGEILNYKVNIVNSKYIFNIHEISDYFKDKGIYLTNDNILVTFESEVSYYEEKFFQFFNFINHGQIDILFTEKSSNKNNIFRFDKTYIITKDFLKKSYKYIFSIGSSDLFDEILKDNLVKAEKYIVVDIGVSESVWRKKLKHPLNFKNKLIEIYTFEVTWPNLRNIYEDYYGKNNISRYQSLFLLPHNNLIKRNKGDFYYDIVIPGKWNCDFSFLEANKDKKVAILYGTINTSEKEKLNVLKKLNQYSNITVYPDIHRDLFEKIILLSKLAFFPISPLKTDNSYSLVHAFSLGKCVIAYDGISTRPYNINNNLVLIKPGEELKVFNEYLSNSLKRQQMENKSLDFAVDNFNLTEFFKKIIKEYFLITL